MTATNRALVASLIESIDIFLAGGHTVEGIRSEMWKVVSLLERGQIDFRRLVERAAVDLEDIEFTMGSGQRRAMIDRIRTLRQELGAGLEHDT